MFWVCALNCLQNSMIAGRRGPGAGPIGGDGLADPAGTCNLMYPVIFFAMTLAPGLGHLRPVQGSWCGSGRLAAAFTSHVRYSLLATHNFSTCPISSSTRVGRPKIETATLR